jgi:hypothetical protein
VVVLSLFTVVLSFPYEDKSLQKLASLLVIATSVANVFAIGFGLYWLRAQDQELNLLSRERLPDAIVTYIGLTGNLCLGRDFIGFTIADTYAHQVPLTAVTKVVIGRGTKRLETFVPPNAKPTTLCEQFSERTTRWMVIYTDLNETPLIPCLFLTSREQTAAMRALKHIFTDSDRLQPGVHGSRLSLAYLPCLFLILNLIVVLLAHYLVIPYYTSRMWRFSLFACYFGQLLEFHVIRKSLIDEFIVLTANARGLFKSHVYEVISKPVNGFLLFQSPKTVFHQWPVDKDGSISDNPEIGYRPRGDQSRSLHYSGSKEPKNSSKL